MDGNSTTPHTNSNNKNGIPNLPTPSVNKFLERDLRTQDFFKGLLSSLRGYRNGIIMGTRIRVPYVLQSLLYILIYGPKDESLKRRLLLTAKQMIQHAVNLGSFVFIFKFTSNVLRLYLHCNNGLESLISGFVAGFCAFGQVKGISGSVNTQIVLYMLARSLEGAIRLAHNKFQLGNSFDIRQPMGFRLFAAVSSALFLYFSDYQPKYLQDSVNATMYNLYTQSNDGKLRPTENRYTIIMTLITISLLLGVYFPQLRFENLFQKFDQLIQQYLFGKKT